MAIDPQRVIKYDRPGPRYTSYPTIPAWQGSFNAMDFTEALRSDCSQKPLSLYVHIPFCENQCFFCGCNAFANPHRKGVDTYVQSVCREMELLSRAFVTKQSVAQIHFGGGSPNFLVPIEMDQIWFAIEKHFVISKDSEIGIEIDPRTVDKNRVHYLRKRGFNRISFGIQDFDPVVQERINRIQPFETSSRLLSECRGCGFSSINVDLVYGLPGQRRDGFSATLDRLLDISPDRIALFSYAHLPQLKPFQRRFNAEEIPSGGDKIRFFLDAHERFLSAGYLQIGMDHFAKPDDELSQALRDRTLHRNFQGYTTRGGCHLIGIGVTSISDLGNCYAQNEKHIPAYLRRISEGGLATCRGVRLTKDDQIRREVIHSIMCHFVLEKEVIEKKYAIQFDDYFKKELDDLKQFQDDGLVMATPGTLQLTEMGKLIVRNVCMVFDPYLKRMNGQFSRTV